MLPLLAAALAIGCQSPPETQQSGTDIRLSGVTAYRHAGERLEASAEAREATLSPDGSAALLEDGAVTLSGSEMRAAAPSVDVDLTASSASGRDGVTVDGPGYSLTGERFELDGEEATVSVQGGVSAVEEPVPGTAGGAGEPSYSAAAAAAPPPRRGPAPPRVEIDADEVVLHRRAGNAVFTGNVVVVRGEMRLTSRTLTVTYGENQRVTHLLARGEVRVTEEDRVITAEEAEFDNLEEVLTLTGDAVLTQGENVIRGDRVVFSLRTDEIRVERVRARVRVDDAAAIGDPEQ